MGSALKVREGGSLFCSSYTYRHLGLKFRRKSTKELAVSIIDTLVPQIALKVAGSGGAEGRDESGITPSLAALVVGRVEVRRFTSVGDSNGIDEWISPRLVLPDRGVLCKPRLGMWTSGR